MNIFLLAALVAAAAAQAAAPFQWEFDFYQCNRLDRGYQCYVTANGKLTNLKIMDYFKRYDYQDHPHVFAVSPQSRKRWAIVMQTRSIDKKVDLSFGMELHKLEWQKSGAVKFLGCRVENGTVVVDSAADLEIELHDSYFNDNHLFCDLTVRPKQGISKTLIDIVSISDNFDLAVKIDGVVETYNGDYSYDPSRNPPSHYWEAQKYISTFVHYLDYQQHDCDSSQVKFDPTEALTWGKVRSSEYYGNRFFCPDSRYAMYVTSSNGRRRDNAEVTCKDGKYEIKVYYGEEPFTVARNETINVVCYVEDKHLCPLSIRCDQAVCPYLRVKLYRSGEYSPPEYRIGCPMAPERQNDVIVFGEKNRRFRASMMKIKCVEHNLVVSTDDYDREFKSPTTNATVGYCERKRW